MANLQVKHIPDPLHDRLRRRAQAQNSTISAVVLNAIERELARWEWRERLSARPTVNLDTDVAALIRAERELREDRD
jgi:hypothetical protein